MIEIRLHTGYKNGLEVWDTLNTVERFCVVYDASSDVLFAMGGYDEVSQRYTQTKKSLKHVIDSLYDEIQSDARDGWIDIYNDMYNNLTFVELPKDQSIVDKVINNTGYLGKFIRQEVQHG